MRLSLLAAALPTIDLRAGDRVGSTPVATDVEVVTVTDTSVVITWSTLVPDRTDLAGRPLGVDAFGELRLAPADSRAPARTVWVDTVPTAYHYAEIHGLEPGRRYRFEAYSDGIRADIAHNVFTTLVPPPGRHLATIALANDVHYGEHVSGLVWHRFPRGFRQDSWLPPYPEVMLDAMLADLRMPDRAADLLLIAGDLTADGKSSQARAVRARLEAWGGAFLVARGNHDTKKRHDGWTDVFGPPQHVREHELGGLRVVGLDTSRVGKAGGAIDPSQFAQLRDLFADEPERPTLVFGHHPVTSSSAQTNLAGPGFVLNRSDAAALQALYRRIPGVFLHHSGHTHRNHRAMRGTVEFLEIGAVKEYPGGYSLVRLYEGGYMVNFYKTRTEWARRWGHRSRGEYYGLFPHYLLGSITDRNHVVLRDLSGVSQTIRSGETGMLTR